MRPAVQYILTQSRALTDRGESTFPIQESTSSQMHQPLSTPQTNAGKSGRGSIGSQMAEQERGTFGGGGDGDARESHDVI